MEFGFNFAKHLYERFSFASLRTHLENTWTKRGRPSDELEFSQSWHWQQKHDKSDNKLRVAQEVNEPFPNISANSNTQTVLNVASLAQNTATQARPKSRVHEFLRTNKSYPLCITIHPWNKMKQNKAVDNEGNFKQIVIECSSKCGMRIGELLLLQGLNYFSADARSLVWSRKPDSIKP